jgi:HK97 family phage major capsid protein
MRLNKLFGLVPVTDELLADSPAISAYLTGLLGRSIKWKVNDAIINGTGAGQPLGIFNARARHDREGRRPGDPHAAGGERGEDVRGDADRLPRRRGVAHHAGPAARSSW